MSYGDALSLIDFWYRKGERYISVSSEVFQAYKGGLSFATYYTNREPPPPDPHGRTMLAYKVARVYVA